MSTPTDRIFALNALSICRLCFIQKRGLIDIQTDLLLNNLIVGYLGKGSYLSDMVTRKICKKCSNRIKNIDACVKFFKEVDEVMEAFIENGSIIPIINVPKHVGKIDRQIKKIISKATQCDEISNNQNLDLERQENEQRNINSESEADTTPLKLEEQINANSQKNQFDQGIPMDIDEDEDLIWQEELSSEIDVKEFMIDNWTYDVDEYKNTELRSNESEEYISE